MYAGSEDRADFPATRIHAVGGAGAQTSLILAGSHGDIGGHWTDNFETQRLGFTFMVQAGIAANVDLNTAYKEPFIAAAQASKYGESLIAGQFQKLDNSPIKDLVTKDRWKLSIDVQMRTLLTNQEIEDKFTQVDVFGLFKPGIVGNTTVTHKALENHADIAAKVFGPPGAQVGSNVYVSYYARHFYNCLLTRICG